MDFTGDGGSLWNHVLFEVMHEDPNNENIQYSDIMECFEKFKQRTGGIIYQHVSVKVTEWNMEFLAKKSNGQLKILEHKETKQDARTKSGEKEYISYTFNYCGKEYKSLKELNKHGIWVAREIRFDNLLELMPWMPYLVAACACDKDKETVYISKTSIFEDEDKQAYEFGHEPHTYYQRKNYAEMYLNICKDYYLYQYDSRHIVEEVEFNEVDENGNGIGYLTKEPDEFWDVKWDFEGNPKTHMTSPKIVSGNKIMMDRDDLNNFLGNKMKVEYVSKINYQLHTEY